MLANSRRQTHVMRLRSRLYPSSGIKPVQVAVPTRCTRPAREIGPRFPFAESILAEATIQPYVHDCVVQIIEAGRAHQFRVFFKNHRRLQPNQSLPRLRHFHGDIVVMRAAVLHPLSVVHMRERDTMLADYLVIRYGRHLVLQGSR
jgi:hypothetical protein